MNKCSNAEKAKAPSCEGLADLRENGCLANCPPCVYETLSEWMKCGKTLHFQIEILV